MAIVEIEDICKSYGDRQILKNFSLKIEEGEMIGLIGESGKGKSTILNIIGLLENYDSGKLIIDGEENIKINSRKAQMVLRNKINYLFQNFALVDDETVQKNLEMVLKYSKVNKKEKIKEVLDAVSLKGYENRKVFELSGGEQQRVALARVMLKGGKLLLADEPTGSLDEKNLESVMNILKKLNEEGKTIIIVTHDRRVYTRCSRVINL